MNEQVLVPGMFFLTVIVLSIGIPLVRSHAKARELQALHREPDSELGERLERIEHAIEAMAVEVERISEGQRFVTRLLADRARELDALPASEHPRHHS